VEINKHLSDKALEDYELVQKALNSNDQLAFTNLMGRYKESVFHTMLKMVKNRDDADDLTIEAFGKAFRKLATYTPSYAFSTWLFKIATNNCIDFIRKQRMQLLSIDEPSQSQGGVGTDLSNQLVNTNLDPEERYIREQRQKIMRQFLSKLSDKYKQMIELRFFEELSYQEIAEKLDLPVGTVKAQLFRAKELLYDILKDNHAGKSSF
jgi:RNA polymerase sigma factor (sigma-70 family)